MGREEVGAHTVAATPRARAASAAVVDGMSRVGAAMAIPCPLRERGVDADALMRESDVAPGHFDDPENVIASATSGPLLRRCVERTVREHVGLRVGGSACLSALGPVGSRVLNAANVREALADLSQGVHLHDRGVVADVRDDVRFETACHLLASRAMPVGKVAASLGYADQSAFTRAFARWSGRSPSRWKNGTGDGTRAPPATGRAAGSSRR